MISQILLQINTWGKLTVVYTFLLSNVGHWQRGMWEEENVLGIRHKNIKRTEQGFWQPSLNAGDQTSEAYPVATDTYHTYQLSPNFFFPPQEKEHHTIPESSLVSPLEATSIISFCCLSFSTYPTHLYRNHCSTICPVCVYPEVLVLSWCP